MNFTHDQAWTFDAQPDSESFIQGLVGRLLARWRPHWNQHNPDSLALVGPYAKSEGSVWKEGSQFWLRQKMTWVWFVSNSSSQWRATLSRELEMEMRQVVGASMVPMEVIVTGRDEFFSTPQWDALEYPLSIRTIWTKDQHWSEPAAMPLAMFPATYVRDHLVTEGLMLLVTREYLHRFRQVPSDDACALVSALTRTIIAYGDSLLYYFNQFPASLTERRDALTNNPACPKNLAQLYADAVDFELHDQKSSCVPKDWHLWFEKVSATLADIHLSCESMRLNCSHLTWENYTEVYLQNTAAWHHSIQDWWSRTRALWSNRSVNELAPWMKQEIATLSSAEARALIFPFLAYNQDDAFSQPIRKLILGPTQGQQCRERNNFLIWVQHCLSPEWRKRLKKVHLLPELKVYQVSSPLWRQA